MGAGGYGEHDRSGGGDTVVRVRPPMTRDETDLLLGLAGRGAVVRMWAGQPASRSPWVACRRGCCLGLRSAGGDPADWMRFLLRDVLGATSVRARERATRFGMPGGHHVEGRVATRGGVLVVRGGRVRLVPDQQEGGIG